MSHEVKALGRVEIKAAGLVTATFSTLNAVDKDGDVTPVGAFEDGASVPIGAWEHSSWGARGGRLPVGKGVIHADNSKAWVEAALFMNNQGGRETFEVIEKLGPLLEWSYSYDVLEERFGEWQGRQVRFLDKLKVSEVAPVLVGAGIGTQTTEAKARLVAEYFRHLAPGVAERVRAERDASTEYLRFAAGQVRRGR
jgi:hypothetical protein